MVFEVGDPDVGGRDAIGRRRHFVKAHLAHRRHGVLFGAGCRVDPRLGCSLAPNADVSGLRLRDGHGETVERDVVDHSLLLFTAQRLGLSTRAGSAVGNDDHRLGGACETDEVVESLSCRHGWWWKMRERLKSDGRMMGADGAL